MVVARLEAFIAGWGLDEALRRADAYHKAGADAILCHSKKADSSDIDAFMKEWGNRCPVIIVPTKYYSVPTDHFRKSRDQYHNLGKSQHADASIKSDAGNIGRIFTEQTLINVESKVVAVNEIFRLQGADELEAAEDKYLPTTGKESECIVLAASQGSLGELTKETPKTLLEVNGKSLLETQVEEFNQIGIKDVTVVRGFKKDKVKLSNIKTVDNDEYAASKELYSLYLAKDQIKENTLISYGDIIFKRYVLHELLNDQNNITIVVDADCEEEWDSIRILFQHPKNMIAQITSELLCLKKWDQRLKNGEIFGEFIGSVESK